MTRIVSPVMHLAELAVETLLHNVTPAGQDFILSRATTVALTAKFSDTINRVCIADLATIHVSAVWVQIRISAQVVIKENIYYKG